MNIADTNGINYIFDHNLIVKLECYLPPDVSEEVEMTQIIHSKKIPDTVLKLSGRPEFDQAIYLDYYNQMLNKHSGKSFFNMTGFGDISILASIHMLLHVYRKQNEECLFDFSEDINVYTDDDGLIKRIGNEFNKDKVTVLPITDLS